MHVNTSPSRAYGTHWKTYTSRATPRETDFKHKNKFLWEKPSVICFFFFLSTASQTTENKSVVLMAGCCLTNCLRVWILGGIFVPGNILTFALSVQVDFQSSFREISISCKHAVSQSLPSISISPDGASSSSH